jgi:hypothetical protein
MMTKYRTTVRIKGNNGLILKMDSRMMTKYRTKVRIIGNNGLILKMDSRNSSTILQVTVSTVVLDYNTVLYSVCILSSIFRSGSEHRNPGQY